MLINEQTKVKLAFAAVCVLWGSTYIAIRIGVSDFPPLLFAGTRFLTAGLLVLLFSRAKGYLFPVNRIEYIKLAVVGLLLLVGGTGLVVVVSRWVHSGMSALLISTIPLFMALLEVLVYKKSTLSVKGWVGLLTGFAGVVFLVISNNGTGAIDILGASLLLLAALSWAVGSIYSKSFQPTGSTFSHIGLHMLSGGIAFFIIGLALGEASRVHLTLKGVGAVLYLVVFGSIIAYSCYIYVLQKWPAAKAGTYAYVNPVVAIMLGALLLKESISFSVVLSSVVILGSVYVVQTNKTVDRVLQIPGSVTTAAGGVPLHKH
jgi:drug/metabolite transporter (DMT)-like permease